MIRPSSFLLVSSFVAFIAGNAHAQAVTSKGAAQPVPPALPAPAAAAPTSSAPASAGQETMPPLPAPAPQTALPATSSADAETPSDETPAPAPAPTPISPRRASSDDIALPDGDESSENVTRAHTGFVAAFSIGYAAPAGSATGNPNDSLSDAFTGQVPLTIEIGGNVTPIIFIGAYGSYAFGGVAGDTDKTCTTNQLDCSAHTLRGGFAFRARFLPENTVRPWVGYAFGYEQSTASLSASNGASATVDISGWELGKFSLGVDFESSEHNAAIGPFIDVGVGQYGHIHSEGTAQSTKDVDIDNTALHQWITIGLKATFMP